eukprot:4288818-Prymnesium_polylepis.1
MLPCALSTRAVLRAVAGVIATGGGAGALCVGFCVGWLGGLGGPVHGGSRWAAGLSRQVALGVRGGVGTIGGRVVSKTPGSRAGGAPPGALLTRVS